jgi:4-alpha-glucanotransferase
VTGTSERARRQLHALARSKGIEVRWRAQDGVTRTCSDDTLVAVVRMLGVDVARPEDAATARVDLRRAQRAPMIDPVVVTWDGASPRFGARLPVRAVDDDFGVVIEHESGAESRWSRRELDIDIAGGGDGPDDVVDLDVTLPRGIELGRHRVRLERGADQAEATLIAAPTHLAPVGGARAWGVFAPVYALHTRGRTETGDLATLDRLARWVADRGGEVVGTLPLLATFFGHGEEPCDPSPYAPVSRRYWNEVYLDLRALPELGGDAQFGEPAPGRCVDLPKLAAARRPLLEAAAARVDDLPVRRAELAAWLDAHPDVRSYARFRSGREGSGPTGIAVHEYAQWMLATQLAELARTLGERGQSLYVDLPVGTHREGYDVAAHPDLFVAGASVGAPPDAFQAGGQDWGFPPIDPVAERAAGYAYLAACLDEELQYARRLRIDHVMGLDRLWMIPPGAGATDGAYVHYVADEHWATVCLAAHRHRASIVGENLGTVPPATDRALRRHRALGMWVIQFELPDDGEEAENDAEKDSEKVVQPAGRGSLACLDTHDLATFATWWRELAPEPRRALLTALRASGDLHPDSFRDGTEPEPEAVLVATLAWLGAGRSPLVLASLEDLWLEPDPQNVPGTADPGATFRQRAAYGLDELDDVASVKNTLDALDRARRTTV